VPELVSPARSPLSSSRGSALKIAAGTAGAGLLVFGIYAKFVNTPANPTSQDGMTSSGILEPSTESPTSDYIPPRNTVKGSSETRTTNRGLTEGTDTKKPIQDAKPQDSTSTKDSPPAPGPIGGTSPQAVEAPAGDLSSISAQALSIARTDGGLQVTVRFTNTGGGQSVRLSMERSILLDNNNGLRYSVVDSDLPVSEPDLQLDLPAVSSSFHTFDFQAPKVGAKKLDLTLLTPDGQRIKVSGSSLTLPDSP
jgi:hypothetical protein